MRTHVDAGKANQRDERPRDPPAGGIQDLRKGGGGRSVHGVVRGKTKCAAAPGQLMNRIQHTARPRPRDEMFYLRADKIVEDNDARQNRASHQRLTFVEPEPVDKDKQAGEEQIGRLRQGHHEPIRQRRLPGQSIDKAK